MLWLPAFTQAQALEVNKIKRRYIQEKLLANCLMLHEITLLWDKSSPVKSVASCNLFNDLENLLSIMPFFMKDSAKGIFIKNPELSWSLVGILSNSLVIGYTVNKYIEFTSNVPEIKTYIEELLVDVDKDVKEADAIITDLSRSIIDQTNTNPVAIFLKIREVEGKLEKAQKFLNRGKYRIEEVLNTYHHNQNVVLCGSGLGLGAVAVLGGVVGFMFPPAGLLTLAGTALNVGIGTAAAVGAINTAIWTTLFIKSFSAINNINVALLSTWQHYDRAVINHEEVKKRLDYINLLICDLANEDTRIAQISGFQSFRKRFVC